MGNGRVGLGPQRRDAATFRINSNSLHLLKGHQRFRQDLTAVDNEGLVEGIACLLPDCRT